ncbi:MAG: RNA methyltransferase [Rhodospirillales bacterium]|nr:RNA methyltransferase [Rhodospirillales bacterium]
MTDIRPPAVVLVRSQLPENVGMAIRAMANFGLDELRLAGPRHAWPDPAATASASGALERAALTVDVYADLPAAIRDLQTVHALTARPRALARETLDPAGSAARLRAAAVRGERAGLVFGPENAGLANDELGAADTIVSIPATGFRSLNLAMSVLLMGYEWHRSGQAGEAVPSSSLAPPAAREDLEYFLQRLLAMLTESGFLYPPEKVPRMAASVRAIFTRNRLSDQELRTLHGILSSFRPSRGDPV